MKPVLTSMALVAASFSLVGCSMDSSMGMEMSRETGMDAANAASMMAARGDACFTDMMIPHHETALEMADQVISRGSRADVRALAQRMKEAQTREIALMRAARQELSDGPCTSGMGGGMMGGGMMGGGAARLRSLSGAALDRAFLQDMIPHHEMAIMMAQHALPNLRRADLRTLATVIIADQRREIVEMRALLSAS